RAAPLHDQPRPSSGRKHPTESVELHRKQLGRDRLSASLKELRVPGLEEGVDRYAIGGLVQFDRKALGLSPNLLHARISRLGPVAQCERYQGLRVADDRLPQARSDRKPIVVASPGAEYEHRAVRFHG